MTPLEFSNPPQRILIIKPSALGDVVHGLPILNLLRQLWPKARISWMVSLGCAGLLQGHRQLDEVIVFNRRLFGQGWWNPQAAWSLLKFIGELRRRKFDLVIDLQGLFRSGFLAWITGAAVRVGFANARELGWIFYNQRVPGGNVERHAIERYLDLAQMLGCQRQPVEFPFAVSAADRNTVADMLPTKAIEGYAVLLPGSTWATKRWPAESFAALVGPLRERFGLEAIIAGGSDAALAAAAIPAASLVGRTNLPQLVALLERASLVIANDSGPMHIASALGRPLVAIFGPTSPRRTGPYGRMDSVAQLNIECSPCLSRRCSHHSCMRLLGIEPVLKLARQQLEKGTKKRG